MVKLYYNFLNKEVFFTYCEAIIEFYLFKSQ